MSKTGSKNKKKKVKKIEVIKEQIEKYYFKKLSIIVSLY